MDLTKQYEKRESFVNWFLICALSGVEITDQVRDKPRNVTMQLNGVEINPLHAIDRLEGEFDRLVEKSVQEKIEQLKTSILNPLEEQIGDMITDLKQNIDLKLSKINK